MYKVTFDVWTWKDIMRVCGSVIDPEDEREMLRNIQIKIERDGEFTAYGANGYQVSKVCGKCKVEGFLVPFEILLVPQKTPPKTKEVEVQAYADAPGFPGKAVHNILYYSYDGKQKITTGQSTLPLVNGEYADLEKGVVKPALDKIGALNHGVGEYMIAVNTHYLINAIKGLGCDTVLINFASRVSPFLIRPYNDPDTDPDAMALICPVRINNL